VSAGSTADTVDPQSVRITGGANAQEIAAVLEALRSAAAVDGSRSRYERWRQRRIAALAKAAHR
jgi:hypothetical protein